MKNFTFEDLHRYIVSLLTDESVISLEPHMQLGLPTAGQYCLTFSKDRCCLNLLRSDPCSDLSMTFTAKNDDSIVTIEDDSGNMIWTPTDFPVNSKSSRFERLTQFPSDVLLRFMAQAKLKSPTLNDLFRYLQGAEETSSHAIVLPDDLRDQFELKLNFVRDHRRCGIFIYRRKPGEDGQYTRIGVIRFIGNHGAEATRPYVECYIDADDCRYSTVKLHSLRIDGIRLADLFDMRNETNVAVRRNADHIRRVLLGILQPMVDRSMTHGPTLVDLYASVTRSVDRDPYRLESIPVQLSFVDKPGTDETTRQVNVLDADRNRLFTFIFRMCRGELSVTMINMDDDYQPQRCSMETVPGTMRLFDLRLPVSCDPTKAETIMQLIAGVTWDYILS